MVQIIQEKKMPSTGERLAAGLGRAGSTLAGELIGKAQQSQERQGLKDFAKKMKDLNPDSVVHQTLAEIYNSDLPFDQMDKIAKQLTGTNPYQDSTKKRLAFDQQRKYLTDRLKDIRDRMKNASTISGELDVLQEEHDKISQELEGVYRQFINDPYTSDMIIEDSIEDRTMEKRPTDKGSSKPKFNPQNQGHRKKAEQLNKKFGGNKQKVHEALSREFDVG